MAVASGWPASASRTPSTSSPAVMVKNPNTRSGAWMSAATLERIGRGELGRSILPWVPLMAGGDEAAVVAEWVRLAAGEADAQRRADYPGLALVFADSVGRLPVWKQALEGFDMWESQVIREWKTAGRVEGRLEEKRKDLRQVLRSRFQSELPADLAERIVVETNHD